MAGLHQPRAAQAGSSLYHASAAHASVEQPCWAPGFGSSGMFCVDFQDLDKRRPTLAVHSKFADGIVKIKQMQEHGALKMLTICIRRGLLLEIRNCVT